MARKISPNDISLLDALRSLLDFAEAEGLREADAALRRLLIDVARALDGAVARGQVVRRWKGGPVVLAGAMVRPRAGNLTEPPCPRARRDAESARLPS